MENTTCSRISRSSSCQWIRSDLRPRGAYWQVPIQPANVQPGRHHQHPAEITVVHCSRTRLQPLLVLASGTEREWRERPDCPGQTRTCRASNWTVADLQAILQDIESEDESLALVMPFLQRLHELIRNCQFTAFWKELNGSSEAAQSGFLSASSPLDL